MQQADRWQGLSQEDADRRVQHRQRLDELLEQARLLGPAEQLFLTEIYQQGLTPPQAARLAGFPASTAQQRLARILQRMQHPLYRLLLRPQCPLPHQRRKVVHLVYARGRSHRSTAQLTGLSTHRVRRELSIARSLLTQAPGIHERKLQESRSPWN